jgi:signal transduction histidine kinase
MSTTANRPGPAPDHLSTGVWDRTVVGWHVAFYVIVALTAASSLTNNSMPINRRWLQVGLLVLLVIAYAILGYRGVMKDPTWHSFTYLGILVAVCVASTLLGPLGYTLLFLVYSQIWVLAGTFRAGVWWVLALNALLLTTSWLNAGADFQWTMVFGTVISGGFALLLGWWISRIIAQSVERAELLTALAQAQDDLAAAHHEAGVMAERERIAREIHDTLAQGFTSIIMLAQATQADLDNGTTAQASARAAQMEATARENLAEARALVRAFSPVALDAGTLSDALARLAASFETETTVEVTTQVDATALPRAYEIVLLRAAQEAFANIRKHAQAQHVELSLTTTPDLVTLTVVDDGKGIDPAARPGFGLRNMRDRVKEVGGNLDFIAGEAGGTRLVVRIPQEDS